MVTLSCVCTLVSNEWPDLHDHFGKSEHAYGHWIDLPMQVGYFQLWRFLQDFPAAADPKQRDAIPLRLMSWLSYQLSQRTHLLIKECMTEFAHIEPVQSDKIFQIGRFHLAGVGDAWTTWDNIRDAVIDEVTIRGKAQQPAVVVRLIRGFLQRLPLPRLLHFLDLVLPQMVPVCSPAQAAGSRFPGSQLIRDLWLKRDEGAIVHEPEVNLMRLFASHAGIEHFRVEWNNKPLLQFSGMEAKEYSSAWSYQNAKAVITTRQNVTMGLKKGNTVLLHFQYHGQLYQAILQMSSSVPGSKGGTDTHKLWKHVIPRSTDFAWLPQEIAETFCLPALQLDPNRPYGTLNQCVPAHSPRSRIIVDQIYFIGESRSASELEVFINMPIERLRVGCGLQCTLPHAPLVPSSRPLLFSAAVKLLKFAMGCRGRCTNSPVEEALMNAMYPLLCNPDEHVLSTLGSLVLALLEGKTDLPISGVFGAGKTRSAAILVVGLLVFEPNLNLMILTKENFAAQAFAEHIEGLNMPQCITSKIGRLVGYMELKKNRTKGTSLDVTCENRHEVLRQKKLLIGCGGGFQQECSQSYSPVARWITEVALTLTDESQQYGNIEETSVIARTSRTCLNIWAGDHRQTPGGLKNTVECRLFRQKLLQRPLALRCGTDYVQPHEMYRILGRYLDGPWGSPSHQLKALLEDVDSNPHESEHMTAVTQLWCEIFGNELVWLDTVVCLFMPPTDVMALTKFLFPPNFLLMLSSSLHMVPSAF